MGILAREGAIFIFSLAVLIFWLTRAFNLPRRLRRDPVLSPDPPEVGEVPLVSILLPVRDEEKNVAECVRSLLEQTYSRLEVIVIDDRSSDRTAEIVSEIARRDGRVRLVANAAEPPPAWSGQVHANVVGVREAKGEWLVFTDADTRHHRAHLQAALGYCLARGVRLLTVFPGMLGNNFWERTIQPFIFWLFWDYYPPASVNRPGSRRGAASGTFIMVERSAYLDLGGWESVANCIPDDVAIMEQAQARGVPAHLVVATETLKVRMYPTLRESFAGWSRYMLSGANNNVFVAGLEIFFALAFNVLPFLFFIFLFSHPASAGALAVSTLLILLVRGRVNRLFGVGPKWAATHPLGALVLAAAAGNSLCRRFAGKGVAWKGRIYLEEGRGIFWTGKRYRLKTVPRDKE